MYDNDHIVWVLPPDVLLPIPVSPTTEIHMSNIQHITIENDAHLRVEAGHIPPGARSQLVDAVLDLPNVSGGTRLEITLPTGDAEMLDQIRNRCHTINTRVAGVSCRLHTTFPRT